jgi:hypothetical protein
MSLYVSSININPLVYASGVKNNPLLCAFVVSTSLNYSLALRAS